MHDLAFLVCLSPVLFLVLQLLTIKSSGVLQTAAFGFVANFSGVNVYNKTYHRIMR